MSPQVVEESTIVVNKLNIGENKPIEPVQYLDYDLVDSEELKALEIDATQSGKKLENQPTYKFVNGKMVSE